jgi:hypothetical protein
MLCKCWLLLGAVCSCVRAETCSLLLTELFGHEANAAAAEGTCEAGVVLQATAAHVLVDSKMCSGDNCPHACKLLILQTMFETLNQTDRRGLDCPQGHSSKAAGPTYCALLSTAAPTFQQRLRSRLSPRILQDTSMNHSPSMDEDVLVQQSSCCRSVICADSQTARAGLARTQTCNQSTRCDATTVEHEQRTPSQQKLCTVAAVTERTVPVDRLVRNTVFKSLETLGNCIIIGWHCWSCLYCRRKPSQP